MQAIAQMISAVLFSLNTAAVSPVDAANAMLAARVDYACGKGEISESSDCSLLSGDSCTAACDATDWSGYCAKQCCQDGADYGEYGECDPNCKSACEYNSWGDCTFNWCGGGSSNVLFCDGQPKATNGELDTCLDYLCAQDFEVDGLVCEGADAPQRKVAPTGR
jgi:prepilin-type processing-associated H-X9-DG protein